MPVAQAGVEASHALSFLPLRQSLFTLKDTLSAC
jgi:hypothetical protein